MNKKQREELTIKNFLNYKQLKSPYARQIQAMLLSMDYDGNWKERPDLLFIDKDKDQVVGVEHFLVDILSEQQHAYSRVREHEQALLFQKYSGDKLTGNEENAAQELMNFAIKDLNKRDNIDYINFIQQFKRIKNQHNSQAYMNALANLCDNVSLGYIIELTYIKEELWYVKEQNNKTHAMRLNNLPISQDMLNIIKSIQLADFVIICTHEVVTQRMDFVVLDVNDFKRSVQANGIHVFKSFISASIGAKTFAKYEKRENDDFKFTIRREMN